MDNKTKIALRALGAAVVLGVLGDLLLRVGPWSLNVFLWTGVLVVAIALLSAGAEKRPSPDRLWLLVLVLIFAAAFMWRDSTTLKWLDGLAVFATMSLVAREHGALAMQRSGAVDYGASALRTVRNAAGGSALLLQEVQWEDTPRTTWVRKSTAILRGVIIAVPFLIIFGLLFMSADAVFSLRVRELFDIDMEAWVKHLLVTFICAWLAGGYLRSVLVSSEVPRPQPEDMRFLRLGTVEMITAVAVLDLLFLSFIYIQFRYLFGGAELVRVTTGLTYSEYARRGFFQLVIVAGLVLPLLLSADWLFRDAVARHKRAFRVLAAAMIVMLAAIMTSALMRMMLYTSAYGLTELRLYTTAFMAWLVAVFVWFAVTVLRGRPRGFAYGALRTGLALILILHVLNPDAFIVQTNVRHAAQSGRPFDVEYATSLSMDAIPALVDAVPGLDTLQRTKTARALLATGRADDWRVWNWARASARRALQVSEQTLQEAVKAGQESNVP